MGPLLEADFDVVVADVHACCGVDEVAEEASGFRVFIAVAELPSQEPVEAAAHEGELEIAVDLHGDGGGESVHVEEVDSVLDAILDEHAPGVAGDQLGGAALELVGQEEGGFFVAEVHDGDLADGFRVLGELDRFVQDPGRPVLAGDAVELNAPPRGNRFPADLLE